MPVSVKGALELRKALRSFAPDLGKELTSQMGAALKPIVREARSFLPSNDQILSNWVVTDKPRRFPQYDAAVAKRGVTYKTTPSKPNRRGFRSIASIYNKTAAGAIYETAGRKTPTSVFVRNMQGKYAGKLEGSGKEQGRVIYRAWERDRGKTQDAVIKAIIRTGEKFEARSRVR